MFSAASALAQNVETDFDAPDSLFREDQFYFNITYNTLQKVPDGLQQTKFSPGFSVGFLRDMPINASRTFAVAAGLGYSLSVYNQNLGIFESNTGTTYEILNTEGVSVSKDKLSLHYVDLPISFVYSVNAGSGKLNIGAGPKFGLGLSGKYKYTSKVTAMGQTDETTSEDKITFGSSDTSDFKTLDLSFGTTISYEIANFHFGVQYYYGLTNHFTNPTGKEAVTQNMTSIIVGYKFGN